ncbi:hypothetical protein ACQ4PT_040476 [Festuca glaucescens]
MEAKAAAVSLSAPLPRCRISNMLACSARRSTRRCRYHHGAPLRSLAGSSSARSFPVARVYASAGDDAGKRAGPRLRRRRHREGRLPDRSIIKLGFRVRAAVRSKERRRPSCRALSGWSSAKGPRARDWSWWTATLEKQGDSGIAAAIGGASLVVCSIGASEKEILDVTGPYRIDYVATANLVRAAASAGVEHFVLVTSLGTTRVGFPAALLNLFWGVLYWKKLAEEALVASGVPYTIVRPGGDGEADGHVQGDAQPGCGAAGHLRRRPGVEPANCRADRVRGQEQVRGLLQGGGGRGRDHGAASAHGGPPRQGALRPRQGSASSTTRSGSSGHRYRGRQGVAPAPAAEAPAPPAAEPKAAERPLSPYTRK